MVDYYIAGTKYKQSDSSHLDIFPELVGRNLISTGFSSRNKHRHPYIIAGLVIVSHEQRKVDHVVAILAQVKNNGDRTWTSVSVEVELLDKNDKFIDECSAYIKGSLKPGDKEKVRIKCGGCKDNPLPPYDKYTIKIKDASSF